MDPELISYLDEQLRQVESLREEVQLLTQAVIGLDERLQFFRDEANSQVDEAREWGEFHRKQLGERVASLERRVAREVQAPLDRIRERFARKTTSRSSGFTEGGIRSAGDIDSPRCPPPASPSPAASPGRAPRTA